MKRTPLQQAAEDVRGKPVEQVAVAIADSVVSCFTAGPGGFTLGREGMVDACTLAAMQIATDLKYVDERLEPLLRAVIDILITDDVFRRLSQPPTQGVPQ